MNRPWICTLTRDIALTGPAVADNVIDVREIAHALSQINRYTGHTTEPWSVAQHCVLTYLMAEALDWKPQGQLLALMHDAHEAYVGDVASPIKAALGQAWYRLERLHEEHVQQQLGLDHLHPHYRVDIKRLDLWALKTERTHLLSQQGERRSWPLIDPGANWDRVNPLGTTLFQKVRNLTPTPAKARDLFLIIYEALT